MRRRALALTALVGSLLTLLAAPASAEARGRIVGLEPSEGRLQVAFSVAGLLPGETVDPDSVELRLDGQPVDVTVQDADTAEAQISRQVILAIDTSGSMAGPGIDGARTAATAYLDQVPADVEVGLVTFSDIATLVVPPTTDRGPIRNAVSGLQATGDTALYDAIGLAVDALPDDGDRQVLLISDGADEGSTATLPQVVDQLRQGDVALNAVAFRNAEVQSTLDELVTAAGGRVVSTEGTSELTAVFTQAASQTDSQIVLTLELPTGFEAREATVAVDAVAAGQPVSDSAVAVGLRALAQPAEAQDFGVRPADPLPWILSSSMTPYLAAGVTFVALLVVIVLGTTALSSSSGTMAERLSPYSLNRRTSPAAVDSDQPTTLKGSVVGLADKVVRSRGLEASLGRKLEAGGVPLKPAEWLLVHVGIVLLAPLFVLLITNANLVLVAVALVLALVGPLIYLRLKESLRKNKFLAQLPDVLQLMSGSLSAGYSLPQAVDAVVQQGNEPVATEFNKALIEARLGAPVEDALDGVAERMQSVDFRWVVMAIRIQREVGGNLAEVLSTVAATLRERERLRRQVRVLSAEGRLSAWILGGLPIAFALYLIAARGEYLLPLIEDPLGWVLIGGMAIFMTVGCLWMRKVVTVEV